MKKADEIQNAVGGSYEQMLKTLYETYGVECPNCLKQSVPIHTLMVRPRIRNKRTGEKMAGVCPVCFYKEPTKTSQISNREAMLTMQAAKKDSLNYLLNLSIFPSSSVFNGKFSNFQTPNAETEKAKAIALHAARMISEDKPIHCLLFGDTGRGKTHLESAMIYEISKKMMYRCRVLFLDMAVMDQMRKMAISDKEAEQRITKCTLEIPKADLVILDDIGRESDSDWGKKFVDDVIRYREDKSLVVSTNLSGQGLRDFYSDQTLSRLRKHMHGYAIPLQKTPDYRESK